MWVIYALLASVIWGLDYLLVEKLVRRISFLTIYSVELVVSAAVIILIGIFTGKLSQDFSSLINSKQTILYLVAGTLSFTIANALIVLSIQFKNATLSSLIEISYPLFIVLFGWILFKQNNLNAGTIFGGALIFLGVLIIFYFNR